jgi:hypothetical protein
VSRARRWVSTILIETRRIPRRRIDSERLGVSAENCNIAASQI